LNSYGIKHFWKIVKLEEKKFNIIKSIINDIRIYYKGQLQITGSYQSIIRNDKVVVDGYMNTEKRLSFLDLKCNSFLDLGCNVGEFCNHVSNLGAKKVLGIDKNDTCLKVAEYISKGNFIKCNLSNIEESSNIINNFFVNDVIDIVFACGIYIEMNRKLWDLLKNIKWKICYVESNTINSNKFPEYKFLYDEIYKQPYEIEEIEEYSICMNRKLWKLNNILK